MGGFLSDVGSRAIGCLGLLVLVAIALGIWTGVTAVFGSPGLHEFPSFQIGGLDTLVTQVEAAAKAGDIASGVKAQTCTEYDSEAVPGLVVAALTGTPRDLCVSSGREPTARLAAPILVIDIDSGWPESVNRQLPETVRAHDLASASTIALMHCVRQKNGTYQNGAAAVDLHCGLVLVQRQAGGYVIVGLRSLNADAPAEIKRTSTDETAQVADRPDDDLKAYLLGALGRAGEPAGAPSGGQPRISE
jgi:hypothetical protein